MIQQHPRLWPSAWPAAIAAFGGGLLITRRSIVVMIELRSARFDQP
jgi:hypothetical protein